MSTPGPGAEIPDLWATDEAELLEYVAGDGLSVRFTVERGTTGRMMPPVDIWEDVVPLTPGSRYRGSRHAARTVVIPIISGGLRHGRPELRALARALDPARGMGRLRSVGFSSGGTGRELNCVYQAGLDALKEEFPNFSRVALQFRAPDPYWVDQTEQVRDFAPANVDTEWFPFFPLDLGGTNILGNFSITNGGDAEAWPTIDVGGPGENFIFQNLTTGQRMAISGVVAAGAILRIVTLPGARAVSYGGANWFSHLSRDSVLWGLAPGLNLLRVTYETTTARIQLRWRLRYLTP
jgi:hypothetical protein